MCIICSARKKAKGRRSRRDTLDNLSPMKPLLMARTLRSLKKVDRYHDPVSFRSHSFINRLLCISAPGFNYPFALKIRWVAIILCHFAFKKVIARFLWQS